MSGNQIMKLHMNKNDEDSPITIEKLDLSKNKITDIDPRFFQRFTKLVELRLSQNQLKSFDEIEITSSYLQTLLLDWNDIETIETKFTAEKRLKFHLIDLSGNKLKQMPKFGSNIDLITTLDMKDQRMNAYLKPSEMPSIFENIPKITEKFILRNSSLNAICCKPDLYTFKSIDISYNYLNEKTLCELFTDVKTIGDRRLNVILFPQLGENKLKCTDLQLFSFEKVYFNNNCNLTYHKQNEKNCKNNNFTIRHKSTGFIKNSLNSPTKSKLNSKSSILIGISHFLSDHFTLFLVLYFFLFLLSMSTFLFCYQRL